ncbi:regulator [Streptomyces marincola]|uniref:regulator n=1 Tax=Streptomyces marincola TaxID=2878388 RepID=UPI001CF560F4|nr:regulator [Streptomyces marincola]UCM88298.1 regulator [Streptomyces marincola]
MRNELGGTVAGQAVQIGTVHGDVRLGAPTGRDGGHRPPWQLPAGGEVVGRAAELASLERARQRAAEQGRAVRAVLTGLGGVGKTALASAWLHTLRDECPDGQLYADLGAQSETGPVPPGVVLGRFLLGLGVEPERVPAGVEERAGLYRTLTSGLRLGILLDDAASAAQVRPLFPGGPCIVAVTSRWRLTGLLLDDALMFELGTLDTDSAVQLLAEALPGDRVAAEPADARALVDLCAGLPLAVRLSAARLAARPRRSIALMVRELAAEHDRLGALGLHDDRDVRAALDVSYRALPGPAARLYRLLARHPGPDVTASTAAAALGEPRASGTAWRAIDALHEAHLLDEFAEGRYRFHDLVRLHARGCAEREEDSEELAAAGRRVMDFYLATATAAEAILDPHHRTLARDHGPGPVVVEEFAGSEAAALAWLEAELGNLLAMQRAAREAGLPGVVWQLADALRPFFLRRKHVDARRAAYADGLDAARADRATEAEFRMLVSAGLGDLDTGDAGRALDLFERAARLCAETGDALGAARTLNYRGLALVRLGRLTEAARCFADAAAEYPRLGDARAGGLARLNLADVALARDRPAEAVDHAVAARATLAAERDAYNAARALVLLGRARLAAGRAAAAEAALDEAHTALRAMAADHEVARVLEALADLADHRGNRGAAEDHRREAVAIYTRLGLPGAAEAVRARRPGRPPGPAGAG